MDIYVDREYQHNGRVRTERLRYMRIEDVSMSPDSPRAVKIEGVDGLYTHVCTENPNPENRVKNKNIPESINSEPPQTPDDAVTSVQGRLIKESEFKMIKVKKRVSNKS